MGGKVDRATSRAVGRAGEAEGATGLDSEMDRGRQKNWAGRTARDKPQRLVPEDTPPKKQVLKFHSELRKVESSVLVQARTSRIGLAKFLYNHKVPGVLSAQCGCGAGEKTPRHMTLFCTEETGRRQRLRTSTYGRVSY